MIIFLIEFDGLRSSDNLLIIQEASYNYWNKIKKAIKYSDIFKWQNLQFHCVFPPLFCGEHIVFESQQTKLLHLRDQVLVP